MYFTFMERLERRLERIEILVSEVSEVRKFDTGSPTNPGFISTMVAVHSATDEMPLPGAVCKHRKVLVNPTTSR